MKADVEHHHVFHEKVLIVSIDTVGVSHVDPDDQLHIETLGSGLFKIRHVTLRTGYQDRTDMPAALALARKRGLLERNLDLEHASYFVSRITITPDSRAGYGPLAQAAVRRHGQERRQPDRGLRRCRSSARSWSAPRSRSERPQRRLRSRSGLCSTSPR